MSTTGSREVVFRLFEFSPFLFDDGLLFRDNGLQTVALVDRLLDALDAGLRRIPHRAGYYTTLTAASTLACKIRSLGIGVGFGGQLRRMAVISIFSGKAPPKV